MPSGSAGPNGGGGASADAGASGPPEIEEHRDFEAPRAGARYVYVANPRRGTVAVIDSAGLGIRSVDVGDVPHVLVTVPGKDLAITLNAGSGDASVLRTDASGTRVSSVPIVRGANRLDVASDGRHAIAWYAADAGPGGLTSLQEISVLSLDDPPAATRLTVGFRPREVLFSDDGSTGFVVTEDGISVVRFAEVRGPAVAPQVSLGGGASRDVSITPDGKHALWREEGASSLTLVDLTTGAAATTELGSPVTDLDLAPSGAFAVAVLRESGVVVRLPIPGGFAGGSAATRLVLTGEVVGSASLTRDGKTAVLYTTAAPIARLVILDLTGADPPRAVRLRKAVRSVVLAPDGRAALIVHTKAPGDPHQAGLDVDARVDRSHGYSLVDLVTGFAKLQLTDTEIGPLAITPDGGRAFLLLRDDARSLRLVQRISLSNFLVDDFPLGSPPVALAALPEAKRVFVSQVHPEGRISFIPWESGAVESVTGFELNGRIVQ